MSSQPSPHLNQTSADATHSSSHPPQVLRSMRDPTYKSFANQVLPFVNPPVDFVSYSNWEIEEAQERVRGGGVVDVWVVEGGWVGSVGVGDCWFRQGETAKLQSPPPNQPASRQPQTANRRPTHSIAVRRRAGRGPPRRPGLHQLPPTPQALRPGAAHLHRRGEKKGTGTTLCSPLLPVAQVGWA
jgi:hypothetical protein